MHHHRIVIVVKVLNVVVVRIVILVLGTTHGKCFLMVSLASNCSDFSCWIFEIVKHRLIGNWGDGRHVSVFRVLALFLWFVGLVSFDFLSLGNSPLFGSWKPAFVHGKHVGWSGDFFFSACFDAFAFRKLVEIPLLGRFNSFTERFRVLTFDLVSYEADRSSLLSVFLIDHL